MMYLLAIALLLTTWRYAVGVRRHGIGRVLRDIIAAIVAGLLAGIMLGICARISMRLLALGLGTPLRLTAEGTFTVVLVFSGLGMILGLPYAGLLRDLVRRNPLAYAVLLILITMQPFIRTAAQDLGLDVWDLKVIGGAVLVTVVMWVPYAVLLEVSYRRLSRLMNSRSLPPESSVVRT